MSAYTVEYPIELSRTIEVPRLDLLKKNGVRPRSDSVHLLASLDNLVLSAWLDENLIGGVRTFGRFLWETHSFRVDKRFIGYSLYFQDYRDTVHCTIRWCDHYG